MTNAQRTWRIAGPKITISPIVGMGIVVAVLAIGVVAVARQAPIQQSTTPAAVAPALDAAHQRADDQWATAPQAFDDLLATARTLNERLQGALQDEQGGPLTPARIASLRDSLTAETH